MLGHGRFIRWVIVSLLTWLCILFLPLAKISIWSGILIVLIASKQPGTCLARPRDLWPWPLCRRFCISKNNTFFKTSRTRIKNYKHYTINSNLIHIFSKFLIFFIPKSLSLSVRLTQRHKLNHTEQIIYPIRKDFNFFSRHFVSSHAEHTLHMTGWVDDDQMA